MPSPPSTLSSPSPAFHTNRSLPAPSEAKSLPPPPATVSLPSPPFRESLPLPPVTASLPSPPLSVSLPALPVMLSLPTPPSSVSRTTAESAAALILSLPPWPLISEDIGGLGSGEGDLHREPGDRDDAARLRQVDRVVAVAGVGRDGVDCAIADAGRPVRQIDRQLLDVGGAEVVDLDGIVAAERLEFDALDIVIQTMAVSSMLRSRT